ncbi:MAG: phage holin family protein, partial [Flavonifractor plautii]
NELTSIVENMMALGVDVPDILVKGLAAARTVVDQAGDKVVPDEKTE